MDAAFCPHCGARNPTPKRAIISLISVVAALLCIIWVYKGCAELLKSSAPTNPTRISATTNSTERNGASTRPKSVVWQQGYSSPPQTPPPQGPPEGCDGAAVVANGVRLYVFRMAVHDPDACQTAKDFVGDGYSFMILGLNATSATEKFTWHCWTNRIVISLNDGKESKTIDLSDMEGFYSWSLSEKFSCTKTVYPGKVDFHYLAFYPSFSWNDVVKVTFFTGPFGNDETQASWTRIR